MGPESAAYEIVQYQPEYRSQVLELQTSEWSPDLRTNAAYLDWKYSDNPFRTAARIYLALHEGQVVGMRAAFDTCWQGGRRAQVMQCLSDADAVVRPEHRRRGLFDAMTAMLLADVSSSLLYQYFMALSANQISSAHLLQRGWQSVGLLQPMYRFAQEGGGSRVRELAYRLPALPSTYRRVRSLLAGRTSRSSAHRSPFATLDDTKIRERKASIAQISLEKEPRSRAMAELVERIGTDGRIRHVRDEKFFAWRFQNPLSEYRFLFCGRERLEGYLVLQTPAYPGHGDWVTIVDWEATSTQVYVDLLRTAVQHGDFDVLTTWSATLSDEAKGVLLENGFRRSEDAEGSMQASWQQVLLVRPILPEKLDLDWEFADRRLLDMSSWDLRPIYSDNY